MQSSPRFDELYALLNPEQKKAVDTVEGPVMVFAGPGTGKTHVLTLRIANILRTTQAKPDSILALTFTDSAARTMRRRLAQIIGEESARKVTITTFHGFAELVRADYSEAFADTAGNRLMGDVEAALCMREALGRADAEQLRPAKAPYSYLGDLSSLYDTLVREEMSFDAYRAWGLAQAEAARADEANQYKRGAKAGELTKAGEERVARFSKVEEAARVFEAYEALKEERGVLDFARLLADTIARIRTDDTLRSDLQERFQYVLADEHQDANALQHELLQLFAYDDFPNLFVVGDDKQAIYRFQGAEADAFRMFETQFPRAATITLTASFRSYQTVLDTAHAAIAPTGTHAALTATRGAGGSVSLIVADDPLDERARIAQLVQAKLSSGIPPHEIALIARTNETGDAFAAALSARGVPVLRAGDIDIFSRPLVRALAALMGYVADPTLPGQLRTALLAPWWEAPLQERLLLLKTSNDSELFEKLEAQFPVIAGVFTEGMARAQALGVGECFSYLFSESGARDYLLSHADHLEDVALVRKLIMHLEEAAYGVQAKSFAEAFAAFSLAFETGRSPLKVSVTEREGAVTVITAHKAKGMEFSCVIIPDCTESAWEGAGRARALPSPFSARQSIDDACRLFYVALTRAKDEVFLSYAKENAEGRERAPTTLIPSSVQAVEVPSEPLPLLHTERTASALVQRLTNEYLEDGRLSPSAINEYLESPATFFARRVLRISEPPSLPLAYGNAVHAALAALFSKKSDADIAQAFERVFARSLLTRDATFEKVRSEAWQAFLASRAGVVSLGEPKAIEKTLSASRVVDGVPVSFGGKVDALLMTASGLTLVDFKTGSAVSATNAGYVRQLRLYAELCALTDEPLAHALLVGISDKGAKEVPVDVSERSEALQEFDTVVREMRSGQWRRAAPSEYDALLTLLG